MDHTGKAEFASSGFLPRVESGAWRSRGPLRSTKSTRSTKGRQLGVSLDRTREPKMEIPTNFERNSKKLGNT